MVPDLVLRHLRAPDDYAAMNAIANAIRAAHGDDFYTTDDQFQQFYQQLDDGDRDHNVAIAELHGRIVGYGRAGWRQELDGPRIYDVVPFVDPNVAGEGVFLVMLDAVGRVVSWNTGAERIFGYDHDEILGFHVSKLFDADPGSADIQLMTATTQGRHEDEGWRRRKNGSQIWAGVITTALRGDAGELRGFAQVTRDVSELRNLERQVLEISDAEQRRIGHDLHDGLGQELTGLAFLTQNLERRLTEENAPAAPEAGRILSLTNGAIDQVRSLARGFSPVELGPDGLRAGLHELSKKIRAVFGVVCEFQCENNVRINDDASGLPLYRIAQEAINNAVRHGKPSHLWITLKTDAGDVVLVVEDDGIGFDATLPRHEGMGIRVMSYRARMIGAPLDIQNRVAGGTIVTCRYSNRMSLTITPSVNESNGQKEFQ